MSYSVVSEILMYHTRGTGTVRNFEKKGLQDISEIIYGPSVDDKKGFSRSPLVSRLGFTRGVTVDYWQNPQLSAADWTTLVLVKVGFLCYCKVGPNLRKPDQPTRKNP